MEIRKLEKRFRGLYRTWSPTVDKLTKEIEERVTDRIALEDIQQLAELCYLEGHKDGYHMADWLNVKTQ